MTNVRGGPIARRQYPTFKATFGVASPSGGCSMKAYNKAPQEHGRMSGSSRRPMQKAFYQTAQIAGNVAYQDRQARNLTWTGEKQIPRRFYLAHRSHISQRQLSWPCSWLLFAAINSPCGNASGEYLENSEKISTEPILRDLSSESVSYTSPHDIPFRELGRNQLVSRTCDGVGRLKHQPRDPNTRQYGKPEHHALKQVIALVAESDGNDGRIKPYIPCFTCNGTLATERNPKGVQLVLISHAQGNGSNAPLDHDLVLPKVANTPPKYPADSETRTIECMAVFQNVRVPEHLGVGHER
ncbi:hypothetical protein FB451DRAFT_1178781 [Mycena latifolia]|nr:hypothetical protein FB451DRAFT_1178781 [Mycena latifolia]